VHQKKTGFLSACRLSCWPGSVVIGVVCKGVSIEVGIVLFVASREHSPKVVMYQGGGWATCRDGSRLGSVCSLSECVKFECVKI